VKAAPYELLNAVPPLVMFVAAVAITNHLRTKEYSYSDDRAILVAGGTGLCFVMLLWSTVALICGIKAMLAPEAYALERFAALFK